jgi:hypothetical protein
MWATNWGQAYVQFPSLYVHTYSHCWIDFRHIADSYMSNHNSTYFENSRRASLAQLAYAIANPMDEVGYSSNVWGLTASDGPDGYAVHGLPPEGFDDGTIAPTGAGGVMAFTPEYSVPTLSYFYTPSVLRRSWPQAASISPPFSRRKVAGTLQRSKAARKASWAGSSGRSQATLDFVVGNQVDLGAQAQGQFGQRRGLVQAVVDAGDQDVFQA